MLPFQQCLQEATHTDQCLTYNSLHDQSAIISQWSVYTTGLNVPWSLGEKKYLAPSVLVSNGYPFSFVQKKFTKTRRARRREPVAEFKSTTVLPYVQGVLEPLHRCKGNKAFVPSDTTLRSHLNRPKDTVDQAKRDGVVYRIPCECGYIGGTGRPMLDRIKEHDRDIRLARTQTSAVLNTPTRLANIRFGTTSSLLIEILTSTHVGSEKYCPVISDNDKHCVLILSKYIIAYIWTALR